MGRMAGPERPPWTLPMMGRRDSVSMAMPMMVLMTASPSVPASMQARALAAMSVWLGESLVMSGFSVTDRQASTTRARHVGVVAEGDAALLDVGAGDVDFHSVDGGVVEAPCHFGILFDGGTAHVGEEAGFGKVQRGQDVVDDGFHAGILQSDGVEHAGRRFPDAVRRVAEPGFLKLSPLEDDGARVAVREARDAGVFLAESDAAGQQDHGRRQLQSAEIERKAVGHFAGGVGMVADIMANARSQGHNPPPCDAVSCRAHAGPGQGGPGQDGATAVECSEAFVGRCRAGAAYDAGRVPLTPQPAGGSSARRRPSRGAIPS